MCTYGKLGSGGQGGKKQPLPSPALGHTIFFHTNIICSSQLLKHGHRPHC